MATSPHLSGRLREALGDDAGEELVRIVDSAAADISHLRGDVAELRQEMQAGFARMEQAMKLEVTGVRHDLTDKIAAVQVDVGNVKADLMKWSFVFWVGAVAAIAVLARVLRA
jgi:hypothetical protein